uniref:Uncharacterized protein n=1 Tax=Trichogramma kaykai TaxID=54128 RepID=A0ABD2X354_9HYME
MKSRGQRSCARKYVPERGCAMSIVSAGRHESDSDRAAARQRQHSRLALLLRVVSSDCIVFLRTYSDRNDACLLVYAYLFVISIARHLRITCLARRDLSIT